MLANQSRLHHSNQTTTLSSFTSHTVRNTGYKVDYITATKPQHHLASLVTQSETLATIATAADDELDDHETSTFAVVAQST